jgi:3-hydroxybutyryl-CoA dehydrogenase
MKSDPVIGVVGAGQMGRGIAQTAAQSGFEVFLADSVRDNVREALLAIEKDLDHRVQRGRLDAAGKRDLLSRIHGANGLAELSHCDIVVEAVTEQLKVKLEVFQTLDALLGPAAILASNTSSVSLTKLAGATQRPDRIIGMHFMNPVPVMKLVEIVRALQTSDATYDATRNLAERMGKSIITTKDMPGFVVNRMLIPFINEACFALQDGVGSVEDIDRGARLGLNHPMGPLELADLIGLDTCLFIAEVLQREFGDDKYRPPALLRNYVAAGWLGRKTNRGFYTYTEGRLDRPSGIPPAP